MNANKRQLYGSPTLDCFKHRHKTIDLPLYASDIDLLLIDFDPHPQILACLDYKTKWDSITKTECIVYDNFIRMNIPVFIVQGDSVTGKFEIKQMHSADLHNDKANARLTTVARTNCYEQYGKWELSLREQLRARNAMQWNCQSIGMRT